MNEERIKLLASNLQVSIYLSDEDVYKRQVMHFFADVFLGQKAHDHKLTMLRRVQDLAEILIPEGSLLDVRCKAFHVLKILI